MVTLCVGILGGSAAAGLAGSRLVTPARHDSSTVLVKFKANTMAGQAAAAIQSVGGVETGMVGGQVHVVKVPAGTVEAAVAVLSRSSQVSYAEPNFEYRASERVPNDPMFSQLWGLKNTGQTGGTPGADIKATFAWDFTQGTSSVVVGVVDTGVDYTHPDLKNNIWNNPGNVGGCPAGTHGYNAVLRTCDPLDDNLGIWHGTHVSGTIGAQGNNSLGVAGVNWTSSIMGLKFLTAGGLGFTADAVAAIDFAVQAKRQGVNLRVLSNSWGGGGYSQALADEIQLAANNDILFVVAAGNDGTDNDSAATYPCNYSVSNIVCVAATNDRDDMASFSNYGATSVHLGAPGVNILSTSFAGNYQSLSGTSMATPHVSGAAALILAQGYRTVADLKSRLLASVDHRPALSGKTVTGGRLNVCKGITGCVSP
jgi:subtilisin family serine protease